MQKLPFYLIALFTVVLTVSNAAMGALADLIAIGSIGLWIYYFGKSGKFAEFWPRIGVDWYLWGYWAVILLGAIFVSGPQGPYERFEIFKEGQWIWFLYGLTALLLYFELDLKRFVQILACTTIVVAIYAVVQTFSGLDLIRENTDKYKSMGNLWRARAFFSNPMTLAYSIGMVFSGLLPFVLFRVFREDRRFSWPITAGLIAAAAGLVVTFTRGAWIAAAVQGVLVATLWQGRRAIKSLSIAAVLVAMIVAVTPPLRKRVLSIGNFETRSISQRFALWRANWEMFKDHPWLGVGARRNSAVVEEYNWKLLGRKGFISNAHNNYFQVLGGTGFFGFTFWFLAMAGIFWLTLKSYWQSTDPFNKALHLGALGAQTFFHVGGLTQATFVDSEVLYMFVFWVALSIAASSRNSYKNYNTKPHVYTA